MKKSNILDNRIFHVAMNVLSSIILVFSILICAVVIISVKSSTGVANLGGYSFLSVQSDSMEEEFFPDDLIVIKRYSKTHRYEVGDIISFIAYDNTGTMYINTHRVHEVIESNGSVSYVTKGDNADQPDKKHVTSSKVLGQYTGTRIAKLGAFFDFASTSQGVMLLIVLPAALIVIWQLFGYLRSLALDKKGQQRPAVAANAAPQYYPPAAQSEKDAIIQEYLRKQQEEEARKQQIIEEYLAKQKELEQAEKEKAEEAKIKAIIAEFLAQQKAAEEQQTAEAPASDNKDSETL